VHARLSYCLLPAAALCALGAEARVAVAQAPNVRVAGRIQVQYRYSSGDSTANYNNALVNNLFEVRRLRIQTDVRFGDNINLVIQPSFEMGSLRMRDAYLRVGFTPTFGLIAGQEKSPFMRYELVSSNNLLSIERGVRVLRLSNREVLNDVLVDNGYASHDLGAFLDFDSPDHRFYAKAGVQQGSRESATDVNNAKSFFGRTTYVALKNKDDQPELQVGASFASRDRAICSTCTGTLAYYADSSKRTNAFGLDVEWGGFRPGWHVIADFATGDNAPIANRVTSGRNVANLRTSADTALRTFAGFNVVAAYRINTTGSDTRVVKIVEPAVRFDYTDPDTDVGDNQGILITPVLNIYFANSVVLRSGIDLYFYKDPTGESKSARELKFSWQANF